MEENKITNDTLSNDLGLENSGGDNVVVTTTTTIVERTDISIVETVKEVKENENEGVYGDESVKVNVSENGESLAMDVEEILAGENGSEVNRIFEGGDPMEVCTSAEKEGRDEMVADIFEWKDETDKTDDRGNVENKEEVEQDESDGEEEDHDFVVGDFVWGKIKSHPWWPGQIYDPSDASDYAASIKRKGRLLVAYFGDGSFSWCSSSQLKPFIENFQEMSKQSDSKKFVNAVQKALEQVSRLARAELMCKCQTADLGGNGGVKNSGIKEGVCAPKGNTIKVLMDQLQPVDILSTLKDSATMEPGIRLLELELTVLKSCLSAFYNQKGGYLLGKYHEPKCIEGLEDKTRGDKNGPSESAENGDNKLHQRRKQKSVSELLGDDERKIKKVKTSKDGGSGKRKRKGLVVSVAPESDHENGDGAGGVEEDTMSPRQRKKSKYLSPPYLSPVGGGKLSILGSGSFKEAKTEPENGSEMDAKQLEDSLKKSTGRKSSQKRRAREGSDPKAHKVIDADVNVDNVLNGLLRAALDPSSFAEKNLPAMTEFISSFRRSIFEEGSSQPDGKKADSPVTLVIEFPAEVAVPTKADLVKTYKKVGDLIKKETHSDGSSAFVVFGNSGDADSALEMSLEKKPFGDVKYRVSEEAKPSAKKGPQKVAGEDTSDLAFIKQKLETMSETVQRCEETEMSANVKATLEAGIKEVLEKVDNMRGK